MRTIAIINQKGGVGKTTTAVNLSAALAESGQRVWLIDLDPQAHASLHLGMVMSDDAPTMYDVLIDELPLVEACHSVENNLWVSPSHLDLAAACCRVRKLDDAERHAQEALVRGYPLPGLAQNVLGCVAASRGQW